ncbi:MAG TPA: glycosyltransferase [Bryobacteraceae bacterium]|nr:glycosyltransferase [Bryobacteraceae bacterium]
MSRLVFVAPPFAGHLNPLLPLAAAARDSGYAVEVITGANKLGAVQAYGLPCRSLQSIPPGSLEAIANTAAPVGSHPSLLLAQFRDNLSLLPAIKAELESLWRADPPALVVADSVAPVGGLVCESMGIPWITTIATPFAMENRTGTPAYCGGWSPGHSLRDAAGRLAIRLFKRAVAWWFRKEFALLGGGFPYRPDGYERIYSPHAILGFGLEQLEFPRDWPPHFQMIGPVVDCPEPGPPLSFPPAAKRVLVSVGTHLLWAKRTIADDVAQLAAEFPGVQFHVSLGGEPVPPSKTTANITFHSFVPYARDLSFFDAVLHHGGAGITYAAILHGLPSVVVPHDYDQFDYAARIEYAQLGRRARSIATAAPALRAVLAEPDRAALEAMRLHAQSYRPAAAFLSVARRLL